MKICYIANSASFHTEKWVNYFLNLGNEVHVISHSDKKIYGANVHYIDYNIRNFFTMKGVVHKTIKDINPDILHAHQANTCGLYATTIHGYKPIVSAWGSDILLAPDESFIMKQIVKHVIKNSYIMTSDSYFMSEKIVKLGGNMDNIYTFPMGVEDELTKYKHEFSDKKNVINILSDRRLEKMFNIDIIIKGFKAALAENENIFLNIAADGSEMDYLKSLTRKLNIEKKVKFIGRYNQDDLGTMLSNNDLFISIPDSDSTSVSLLEAMCCGLFPIVCNLPANCEWVKNKENGIVINKIHETEVRDAILWCIKNYDKVNGTEEFNMNMIREKALWKNNAKIVEDIYDKVLNDK